MTVRVTAAELDVLTISSEVPEPIPLQTGVGLVPVNPMMFPNDWSVEVSLETRWVTDKTEAFIGGKAESTILLSRPSRKMKARVIGGTREESHAILLAALGYSTQLGAPVPLYPDAAGIKSVVVEPSNINRIYGDFSRRRFFVGGRVAFLPLKMKPNQADNSVVLGILKEVAPGHLKVEFNPLAFRTITTNDVVAPCFDAELIAEASGVSLTDTVYQLEMEWSELDGSNSLPAIWPAISPDNADILGPLCQIVDNLPVFPLTINWADGVQIDVLREMEIQESGRTSIQEPIKDTRLSFEAQVMGQNRESSWKILRFFDALRGRAGDFYFIHPGKPWKLGTFPSTTQCTITAIGNTALISYFKKVAFFRADGTFITRTVSSYNALGSVFQLAFSALPDTNFVDVQPIFVCKFESDSIEESWNSTEVIPNISFRMIEQPNQGVASYSGTLGYSELLPDIMQIPGCNLMLRAGVKCYAADGKPTFAWPSRDIASVDRWEDCSKGPSRFPVQEGTKHYFLRQNSTILSDIVRFPLPYRNRGQVAIKDPAFVFLNHINIAVPAGDKSLWSSAGWTVFFCFTPDSAPTGTVTRKLFNVVSNNGESSVSFNLDTLGANALNRAKLIMTKPVGQLVEMPTIVALNHGDFATYMTLRFNATTQKVHCWINGLQGFVVAADFLLEVFPNYSVSNWFHGFNYATPVSSAYLRTAWFTKGCINMLASYNRPMAPAEIDQVHTHISNLFGTTYRPVSIYA